MGFDRTKVVVESAGAGPAARLADKADRATIMTKAYITPVPINERHRAGVGPTIGQVIKAGHEEVRPAGTVLTAQSQRSASKGRHHSGISASRSCSTSRVSPIQTMVSRLARLSLSHRRDDDV